MPHSLPILVAEDEESDVMILRMAVRKAELPNRLIFVRDGQEMIGYLEGAGRYQNRAEYPLPGLLILDLKMPRMTGFDVLAWLAKHPRLNVLPTVVLSSSSHHADIAKAREMGAKEFYE